MNVANDYTMNECPFAFNKDKFLMAISEANWKTILFSRFKYIISPSLARAMSTRHLLKRPRLYKSKDERGLAGPTAVQALR